VNDVGDLIRRRNIGRLSTVKTEEYAAQIVALFEDTQAAEAAGREARRAAEQELDLSIHGTQLEELYFQLRGGNCVS
jgi:glycosyltransferase involved in cell wall biosynthesis